MSQRRIVVTDAAPPPVDDALPEDAPCPRCQAGPERRVLSGGFGEPYPLCGKCGRDLRLKGTIDGSR